MNVAAHHSMIGVNKWVNPYVTDGLIAMYDGIWNAGEGIHDSSTLVWKNLGTLGGTYDATRRSGTWQDNGAVFSTNSYYNGVFIIPGYLMRDEMKGEWSYEIGFTPTASWKAAYHGLWGNHASGKGINGGQYEGNIAFNLYYPNVTLYSANASAFAANTKCTICQSASNTTKTASTWKDGALVSSKSNVDVLLTFDYPETCIGAAFKLDNKQPNPSRTFDGIIHFLRVYNKPINDTVRTHNRLVDIERYGIP